MMSTLLISYLSIDFIVQKLVCFVSKLLVTLSVFSLRLSETEKSSERKKGKNEILTFVNVSFLIIKKIFGNHLQRSN